MIPAAARAARALAALSVLGLSMSGLALTGCTADAPEPTPSTMPSPTPSRAPAAVDVNAPALKAASAWLTDRGYTVQQIEGDTMRFTDGGENFTTKLTCEGGPTHAVGWLGVCATTPGEALGVVIPTRVTAGPKVLTAAMDEDAAAGCGDETTPTWAITALQTAAESYCFLSDEDG